MAIIINKYEFDLVVKHYGEKEKPYQGYYENRSNPEDVKIELLEKLEFKTLSAVEVIRKLLDYI